MGLGSGPKTLTPALTRVKQEQRPPLPLAAARLVGKHRQLQGDPQFGPVLAQPVVHHTVRGTYGTPEAGMCTAYVPCLGPRGKLPCASGTQEPVRVRRCAYPGTAAEGCGTLWHSVSTQGINARTNVASALKTARLSPRVLAISPQISTSASSGSRGVVWHQLVSPGVRRPRHCGEQCAWAWQRGVAQGLAQKCSKGCSSGVWLKACSSGV